MKKLLILLIVSSLSLFATINGHDEIFLVKEIKKIKNIPSKDSDYSATTDLYVEPNKTSSRGGKEIVYEYTLNSTKAYNYKIWKEKYEELLNDCKGYEMWFRDKLDNVIIRKFKHLGKTVFQVKQDASMCR